MKNLNLPDQNTWIGGKSEDCELQNGPYLYDPNTSEALVRSRSSSSSQIERAIGLANETHLDGAWSELGIEGRAPMLYALADELDAHVEEIAQLDSLNSGVPIRITRMFASSNGDTVRAVVQRALALGNAEALSADGRKVLIHRIPWGATALIMPWNAPSAMAVKKLSFALAAGATVVMKPSPASPFSTELVAKSAAKANIPHGVVSLVLGGANVGAQLVSDRRIRAISMTGSTTTGRSIAVAAGANFARLRLELSSNNPAIVCADADVDHAAKEIASGAMKLSGQWCEAPRRVIVAQPILQDFVAALREALAKLRIGSSLDDDTDLGPVAFEARKLELLSQRDALKVAGAEIIEIGSPQPTGWFVQPTIAVSADIDPGMEIFGPLITVQPSASDDHAIKIANSGHVGLAAYMFSSDIEKAHILGAKLQVGEVKINGTSVLDMSPISAQSFFGESGIGGHGDEDVFDFYSGKRIVGTDMKNLPI
ncbi:aldehyde dehydrogenase family protein [Paraburkholderia acidicola]|uniref:Aldehyde dehydrogenase family protein n=1 Tax=Paraburkholderia acidicola TaxID=1912599 RepID=A0ABV1LUI9_9BURK